MIGNRLSTIKRPEKICPNLVTGRIYITHQNYVIPCCMMHFDTELNYFGTDQLRDMTEGFDRHNIAKFPLSTSFKNGNLLYTCEKSCHNEIEQNLKEIA